MRRTQIFIAAIIIALVYSCNFTEEIHLKEDGSGRLSISFDGSEMMDMAGDEMAKTDEKAIDSIISFKDFLEEKKDSIAQLPKDEQEKLKKLEPFSMRMVMDPEKSVMMFDLFSEFKNVNEVNDAFSAFQDASSIGGKTNPQQGPMKPSEQQPTEVNYTFKKNRFTRTAKIVDQELFQQQLDSLQGAEMFLSGSTYTLKYHFPRKIKSTTAEAATFSQDGKTLIYEVNFMDMMKNPSVLDLEVELEK
ncbi:MAG: hypothetical protein CMH46_18785 [Muricauda sp.]|nr:MULTISPECIES: hypothetical protein [unclassified Allomuricauda]MAU17578.1 hypothetical protein [Allomuricauda sp.]|tara:strand:- start:2328 stop:3068 length:741 start_codon:yes stop_codon:yes gene_type:complete